MAKIVRNFIFLFLLLVLVSCWRKKEDGYTPPARSRFALQNNESLHIDFINKLRDTDSLNAFKYRNFYNGAGLALEDFNNDGRIDIFLCGNQLVNKLYINQGDWIFEDYTQQANIASSSAWTTGVATVDINADGWMDIYVCHSSYLNEQDRRNELFINGQDGTFQEAAAAYGLDDAGLSTHAAFFDYDQDGDLDCYILNNSLEAVFQFDQANNLRLEYDDNGQGDKLMQNNNGYFTDVTAKAGIYSSSIGFGLGVSIADFNNDHWPDIYVSNDFFERDYLYINQKDGTFIDDILNQMGHISLSSMGSDVGDINNDGMEDLFTTEMLPEDNYRQKRAIKFESFDVWKLKTKRLLHNQYIQNTLQLNNGNSTFSEIAAYAHVMATDWSWSPLFFDFDNDGWQDIYVSNGVYKDMNDQDFIQFFASEGVRNDIVRKQHFDYKEFNALLDSVYLTNYAFHNQGNLHFSNQAKELGMGYKSYSSGTAYGDLDQDGDLDLVVNNVNQRPFIYRNRTKELDYDDSHYLEFMLRNSNTHNLFGIGTSLFVYTKGEVQRRSLYTSRGFQSSVPARLHLGIGKHLLADSVVVYWSAFQKSVYTNMKADSLYILEAPTMQRTPFPSASGSFSGSGRSGWFVDRSGEILEKNRKMTEDTYLDFDVERLMPQVLSREGPSVVSGDINKDGLEDFLVTAPAGIPLQVYIQRKKSSASYFTLEQFAAFERDKEDESVDAAIADFNGDGRQDILVVHGGNYYAPYDVQPEVLMYVQDKKGQFVKKKCTNSPIKVNGSRVLAFDYDGDGDWDALVTGRSVPGEYGVSPRTYLLENNGSGIFSDVTSIRAPLLATIGMVSDVVYEDIDEEAGEELIVGGDWFPPSIFKYDRKARKFRLWKQFPALSGFIFSLDVADINKDGRKDILVGNYGLNSKLYASKEQPMRLWVNDFDKNGQKECFISYYKSDGRSYPLHQRDDATMQMPIMKKKFLHYKDYARYVADSIFTPEQMKGVDEKVITQLASVILWNRGEGTFESELLPARSQFAPIYAMQADDFNKDGWMDILLLGNLYGVRPELGRYDANYGTLLSYNDGKWQEVPPVELGVSIKGEARSVVAIDVMNGKQIYVIGINDAPIRVIETAL